MAIDKTTGQNQILDNMMKQLNLKNAAALSRALEVAPPLISKLRHGALKMGASMLIRIHEETDVSIAELKITLGCDQREVIS
ncbi:hypothetical protein ACFQAT_25735 [Undibacterium arcticum]|uniref:HTH cro/C1-type domain-containing protein n=1 Tax=Undibacterium arcticum TaxID=1762892 RepID=A0ABV7F7D5_9BURK